MGIEQCDMQTPLKTEDLTKVYKLGKKGTKTALDSLTIEVTGPEDKIESLVELLDPYGIKELVRTGRVTMVRGAARGAFSGGGGSISK